MPIYEYLCNSCGAKKEHIQKMSDAPITICPACGSEDYAKQISAAGFQLKGSGWYVTDFKNKPSQPAAKTEKKDAQTQSSEPKTDTTASSSAPKSSEMKAGTATTAATD